MDPKDLFPDYLPKTTRDTVRDYLKKPSSKMFKILNEIGEPTLEKLKALLELFDIYREEAQKYPGSYRPGNVI